MADFVFPPMGYGPGSQPEPDGELEYMTMPQDMRTFTMHIPDIEPDEAHEPALSLLKQIAQACADSVQGAPNARFDLAGLDKPNRALMAETLGQGEVSMRIHGIPAVAAQESVFAGVWVLKGAGLDAVEVGKVPTASLTRAFEPRRRGLGVEAPRQPGVLNAPPLMVELADKSAAYVEGQEPHVVNLTLLPHTEEDLVWLDQAMGQGSTEVLSRGYGNCRVSATALAHVWRVQFFNSMDTLILDTFEVTGMPEVAIAAVEDLSDSAERIAEVLEAIR